MSRRKPWRLMPFGHRCGRSASSPKSYNLLFYTNFRAPQAIGGREIGPRKGAKSLKSAPKSACPNPDVARRRRVRPRDRDPHVTAQRVEKTKQTIGRKPVQPAIQKCRDLWLANAQQLSGGSLSQTATANKFQYTGSQLGFGQVFFGIGNSKVGKNIAAAMLDLVVLRHVDALRKGRLISIANLTLNVNVSTIAKRKHVEIGVGCASSQEYY